jgi:hypothetical protein
MRDVLRPLSRTSGTAILPFQYRRLSRARRVIVEACPASTLNTIARQPRKNSRQALE